MSMAEQNGKVAEQVKFFERHWKCQTKGDIVCNHCGRLEMATGTVKWFNSQKGYGFHPAAGRRVEGRIRSFLGSRESWPQRS